MDQYVDVAGYERSAAMPQKDMGIHGNTADNLKMYPGVAKAFTICSRSFVREYMPASKTGLRRQSV